MKLFFMKNLDSYLTGFERIFIYRKVIETVLHSQFEYLTGKRTDMNFFTDGVRFKVILLHLTNYSAQNKKTNPSTL